MTFGEKLTKARKEAGLTQEKLAEQLDVSFQAVSTWERDENLPDTDHLVRLSRVLNISLDALLRNDIPRGWELGTYPFSPDRTYTQLKTKADALGLRQTRTALPLMREKHAGQYRSPRKDKIPYCVHPMALACHALAMGIRDDDIIAAALLHDVVEDTETRPEELPVNDRLVGNRLRLQSSDAHHLGDILEAVFDLDVERFSLGGLFDTVSGTVSGGRP